MNTQEDRFIYPSSSVFIGGFYLSIRGAIAYNQLEPLIACGITVLIIIRFTMGDGGVRQGFGLRPCKKLL
jgi:hypothetical protein